MPNADGSRNWADVKDSIATRLNRPNYNRDFIQLMCEERANVLAAAGLFPQEQTDTSITTNAGQYMYLLARGTVEIRMVRLMLNGGVWIPLTRARSYEDILISDPLQPPFTAIPSTAKVFGRMIRLWPTPNAQFPLELTLLRRADIPTDDTNSDSFWVDEGRALIVNEVCKHIAAEVLHQPDWAGQFGQSGAEALDAMEAITNVRNGPHIASPYY